MTKIRDYTVHSFDDHFTATVTVTADTWGEAAEAAGRMATIALSGAKGAPAPKPAEPLTKGEREPQAAPPLLAVGDEYGGQAVVDVGINRKEHFAVYTLDDGTRVKWCLRTGTELGRKPGKKPQPAAAVEAEPVEAPPADAEPVDEGPTTPVDPDAPGVAEAAKATKFKDAVVAIHMACEGDAHKVLATAKAYKDAIPAFDKVAASKFQGRLDRALATLG